MVHTLYRSLLLIPLPIHHSTEATPTPSPHKYATVMLKNPPSSTNTSTVSEDYELGLVDSNGIPISTRAPSPHAYYVSNRDQVLLSVGNDPFESKVGKISPNHPLTNETGIDGTDDGSDSGCVTSNEPLLVSVKESNQLVDNELNHNHEDSPNSIASDCNSSIDNIPPDSVPDKEVGVAEEIDNPLYNVSVSGVDSSTDVSTRTDSTSSDGVLASLMSIEDEQLQHNPPLTTSDSQSGTGLVNGQRVDEPVVETTENSDTVGSSTSGLALVPSTSD